MISTSTTFYPRHKRVFFRCDTTSFLREAQQGPSNQHVEKSCLPGGNSLCESPRWGAASSIRRFNLKIMRISPVIQKNAEISLIPFITNQLPTRQGESPTRLPVLRRVQQTCVLCVKTPFFAFGLAAHHIVQLSTKSQGQPDPACWSRKAGSRNNISTVGCLPSQDRL